MAPLTSKLPAKELLSPFNTSFLVAVSIVKLALSEPTNPRSMVKFSSCFKLAIPSPIIILRSKTKSVVAKVVSSVVLSFKVKAAAKAPKFVFF